MAAQRVLGSRMRPSEPGLRTTGLHEFGRQSQPSRRGCHSRELQEQPFTFCRRFGTASIFSTVFSMHSIGFLLRATEPGWKSTLKIPRYYVSLQTQGSIYGKWVEKFKYLGVVFTSDGRRSARIWIHRLAKLTQFCVSFMALWTKRELSNTAKLSVFISVFIPILTYGYGHESWVMTKKY